MVDIETLEKTDTESLDLSKMDKGDTLPEEKVEEKTEAYLSTEKVSVTSLPILFPPVEPHA